MKPLTEPQAFPLQHALAYWWYICGQSVCYWGIQTAERTFFRIGLAFYSWALGIWPTFALAYYRRGLVRGRELGQYYEAIRDLSRAIELEPEWAEPYLQRGLFQRFHGDSRAALQDLERFLSLGGELYWRMEAERQIRFMRDEG